MRAMTIPTHNTAMKMGHTAPKMSPRPIPIHRSGRTDSHLCRMSPIQARGSLGADGTGIVRVFCAHLAGLVNATNVQGVGP